MASGAQDKGRKSSMAGFDGLQRRQCSAITLAKGVRETRGWVEVSYRYHTAAAPAQYKWTTMNCSFENFLSTMAASRRCQPSRSASLNAGRSAAALSGDGAFRPSMLSTINRERRRPQSHRARSTTSDGLCHLATCTIVRVPVLTHCPPLGGQDLRAYALQFVALPPGLFIESLL